MLCTKLKRSVQFCTSAALNTVPASRSRALPVAGCQFYP